MGTAELNEIFELLKNRGWKAPIDSENREAVIEAVEHLVAPRFCGVAAQLGDGNQYCGFPETIREGAPVTYHVRDFLPARPLDLLRADIRQALDIISDSMQIDFVEVDSPAPNKANVLFTAANLGGPLGVLADAQLCICGITRNSQFQSLVRVDVNEQWVNSATTTGMNIDTVRAIGHEAIHSLGGYHISGRNWMAPSISSIRSMQEGDILMLEGIGYIRRKKTVPLPPAAPAPGGPPARGRPYTTALSPGQSYTAKGYAVAVDYVK